MTGVSGKIDAALGRERTRARTCQSANVSVRALRCTMCCTMVRGPSEGKECRLNGAGANVEEEAKQLLAQPAGPELDLQEVVGKPARHLLGKLGLAA